MKKIICIHLFNDYSGSPLILSQTIECLRTNNYEVEVFTSNTEGFLSTCNVKVNVVFYKRGRNKLFVLFYYLLSQVILFFKLLKYINQDVIFYINTMMPFGAGLAGKLIRKDVIYHIHETSVKPEALKKFLLAIIKLTSSKNIFVSDFLAELEPIDGCESVTIYNALSKSFADKAYSHLYDINGLFNILMVGSLKEYKGILEFLEIAKLASNINFTLVLNASSDEIDFYFKDRNLPKNAEIFPSQSNIHPFYEKASVVLNLSRVDQCQETFGMTILEAMSYGIPCIVPPVGGPLELVDDQINGYCISSYHTQQIAKTIKNLMSDKNRLRVLSDNARLKSKHFKQEMFSSEILKVVNAVNEKN